MQAISWRDLGASLPVGRPRGGSGSAQSETATVPAVLTMAIAQADRLAGVTRQASPWLPPLPALLE
ncbi:hypothetical protein [Streptomyces sp. NPDC020362]|uniref:hypothetical protein n=1 Tax=unclassified Streptomyces TaxID=2593676 RepID=UPI0033C29B54